MQQSYKIYVDQKVLTLLESFQIGENPDPDICKKVWKKSELQAVLDTWVASELPELFLYSDHPAKDLFKKLKKLFRIVIAGGGLVMNTKKQLLFIRRYNLWDLPKGKANKGEHIIDTATREVSEETGLAPLKVLFALEPTYHIYYTAKARVFKKTHWYLMLYEGNSTPVPQLEEAITEVRWFNLEESEVLSRQTYSSLQAMLNRAIALFHGIKH